MSDQPEGSPPDSTEFEGGPVKSFLEHLEDLRWMLIKVSVTLAVAMLACLLGGNHIVRFLSYPLKQATHWQKQKTDDSVAIHWGTNVLARFARTNLALVLPEGDTNIHAYAVIPKNINGEIVLALQPEQTAPAARDGNLVLLKNYSPISAFMVAMKLALYGGGVLSLPLIIYFIGQFVLPALKVKEKQFALRALAVGGVLFLLGMAFCYFLLLDVALGATVEFSQWLGFSADEWRAEDYISFVCVFMLAMGASFELPVIILALVKIGLLDARKLNGFRPYWVVVNLVICAFVTPSADPFSMFLMALPLHLLYEISLLVALYWDWRDRRRAAVK